VCLIKVALLADGIEEKLTESISLILMIENEDLKFLALAIYIQSTKPTLLIESEPFLMNFVFNKDITLRSILGNDDFIRLIHKTVELIGSNDRVSCICLLDKIK